MYPDFQYLVQSLSGIEAPAWLSLFKTFGFFVAMAFLAGAYVLAKDLKRKAKLGIFPPEYTDVETGKPITIAELAVSGVLGFLLGYKIVGLLGHASEIAANPMEYVLSMDGNLLAGIAGALILAYLKYAEKKKEQLSEPKIERMAVYPHQRISEFVVTAAIAGILGAKLFNAFETWEDFIKDPIGNLLSPSGLTFYGGLITAAVVIALYANKHHISIRHLADSFALALMLAYGLGRLGCQFAGDGDWGIFNSAYVSEATGELKPSPPGKLITALHSYPSFLADQIKQFGSADNIPHFYAPAPAWLPDWMFAMNYPHNINNTGMPMADCTGHYCSVLPAGVFPTPLYEAFTCILLFLVLLALSRRIRTPLHLAGIYLIMNGLERFFVEKIRVNYKYDWGFLHPSQAEIISAMLVLLGAGILLVYRDKSKPSGKPAELE